MGMMALTQSLPPSNNDATTPTGANATGTIDRNIFTELERQGVKAAPKSTDAEFLRRVSLDLVGRIPAREKTLAFLSDTASDKRPRLVEELLASPEFTDRWTMYFGDLFKNTARNQNINRAEQGRNAFYAWIKEAIAAKRPYDQIARDVISATGDNSFDDGATNFLIGYRVTGGPVQDVYDQQAAAIAETFLGMAHMNCILCHSGRGRLDTLSVWGKAATRYQAWEFASFVSKTNLRTVRIPATLNQNYYSLTDDGRLDYTLNTTTGNRPARQPLGDGNRYVAPRYPFTGKKPSSGEPYRAALARELTADPQFARAAVNYIWAELFSRGLVEPVNQFDPARLDPDNPPVAPWTLQPSNARLLNEVAADFAQSKFDLRALMRQIVNSEAYQLSARYNGDWNPAWEPLFARKLARRLSGEEIHDAVVTASGIAPVYRINEYSGSDYQTRTTRNVNFAMQLPEPSGMPDGFNGAVSQFLDSFYRGNRDDQDRLREGSVPQALNLMNDTFVMTRIRSSGTGASASLLNRALATADNNQIVEMLYLSVLSRYPTDVERSTATTELTSAGLGNRPRKAEDLLWSLFNKVDFIFNY